MRLASDTITLGGKTVLAPMDKTVQEGELIVLVGPNGAGKSTWLKVMAGVLPGLTHTPQQSPKSRAKAVAYLAQTPLAPSRATVAQIVALGRTPYVGALGRLSETDTAAIDAAISQCHLQDFRDRQYRTLSGGEQMRAHLARAFATQAKLLLADEPITALDPQYQLGVMTQLRDYTRAGHTVITALHDLALARQFADRVWVLHDGHLVQDGAPDAALADDILAEIFKIRLGPNGLLPV